jgi:hypothetical protein
LHRFPNVSSFRTSLKEDDVLKSLSRSIMMVLFAAFVAASIGAVVYAQTTPPQTATNPTPAPAPTPATPPRTLPPDQTAFTAANAKKDPTERLAALKNFKTEFPSSAANSAADTAILDTLIGNFPDRKDEINKAIDVVVGNLSSALPGYLRMSSIQSIVLKLADKKVALDKARVDARAGRAGSARVQARQRQGRRQLPDAPLHGGQAQEGRRRAAADVLQEAAQQQSGGL